MMFAIFLYAFLIVGVIAYCRNPPTKGMFD